MDRIMLCINNSSNHLEGSEEVTEVLESDGGGKSKTSGFRELNKQGWEGARGSLTVSVLQKKGSGFLVMGNFGNCKGFKSQENLLLGWASNLSKANPE